jgi:hypothetical protein
VSVLVRLLAVVIEVVCPKFVAIVRHLREASMFSSQMRLETWQ